MDEAAVVVEQGCGVRVLSFHRRLPPARVELAGSPPGLAGTVQVVPFKRLSDVFMIAPALHTYLFPRVDKGGPGQGEVDGSRHFGLIPIPKQLRHDPVLIVVAEEGGIYGPTLGVFVIPLMLFQNGWY